MSIEVKCHASNKPDIDLAMSLPVNLRCDDGREFDIVSWEPLTLAGSEVTAKINVVVRVPKGEKA